MVEKTTRISDPIHNFVELGPQEKKVVDSYPFQRLRNLQQLQHASVVFPSATHTRFAHSLGTMHVAGQICDTIELEKERRRHIRLAALVHDVGHGPFSHIFEQIAEKVVPKGQKAFNHEVFGQSLLEYPALKEALGDDLGPVRVVLQPPKGKRSLDHDIISSGLDADKMDYLQRDAFFAGLAGARFDYPRLVASLAVYDQRYLVVEMKGLQAVDGFRVARFQIHRTVHHHRAAHAAEGMLLKAVQAEAHENEEVRKKFLLPKDNDHIAWLMRMGDLSFMSWLSEQAKNQVAQDILQHLEIRSLYKRAEPYDLIPARLKSPLKGNLGRLEPHEFEELIVEKARVSPFHVVVRRIHVDVKQYGRTKTEETRIHVIDKRGDMHLVDELGMPTTMEPPEERRTFYYVLGHPDHIESIRRATAEVLNDLERQ